MAFLGVAGCHAALMSSGLGLEGVRVKAGTSHDLTRRGRAGRVTVQVQVYPTALATCSRSDHNLPFCTQASCPGVLRQHSFFTKPEPAPQASRTRIHQRRRRANAPRLNISSYHQTRTSNLSTEDYWFLQSYPSCSSSHLTPANHAHLCCTVAAEGLNSPFQYCFSFSTSGSCSADRDSADLLRMLLRVSLRFSNSPIAAGSRIA